MNTLTPGTSVLWYMTTCCNGGNGITLIEPTLAQVVGVENDRIVIEIAGPDGSYYRKVKADTVQEAT